jgi:hypothetical protein
MIAKETPMFARMGRCAITVGVAVAVTLLLAAGQAQAQSRGGCGRGRSSGGGQQNALRYTPQQQYAMMTPAQQQALLAAMQQLQQQQQALLAALQQQQNVLRAQQRNAAAAQLAAVQKQVPERKEAVQPSANREEIAARQLKLARWLVSDADTAQKKGERDLSARLRDRAGERLQDLVAQYGGTKAADAAQVLLKELQR